MIIDAAERSEQDRFLNQSLGSSNAVLRATVDDRRESMWLSSCNYDQAARSNRTVQFERSDADERFDAGNSQLRKIRKRISSSNQAPIDHDGRMQRNWDRMDNHQWCDWRCRWRGQSRHRGRHEDGISASNCERRKSTLGEPIAGYCDGYDTWSDSANDEESLRVCHAS